MRSALLDYLSFGLFGLVALAHCGEASAQDALLLQQFTAAPKRLATNPAAEVPHRAWLSLPLIGHLDQSLALPWRAVDLLSLEGASLRSGLANGSALTVDLGVAAQGLTPVGRVRATTRVNLLAAGMRLREGLVHVAVDQVADLYAAIGPDVVEAVRYGPTYALAQGISVRDARYDASVRTKYSVGYQWVASATPWRLGVNLHAVRTQANAYLRSLTSTTTLDTATGQVAIRWEGQSRSAGITDLGSGTTDVNALGWQGLMGRGGWGVGVDLGATYEASDALHLSASLVDLGVAGNRVAAGTYALDGEIAVNTNEPADETPTRTIDQLTDQIEAYDIQSNAVTIDDSPYTRPLYTTLYLGGTFDLDPHHGAGLTIRTGMRGRQLQTAAAASYSYRAGDVLQLSTSAGWTRGAGFGLGLGASLQLTPFVLYLGSDNILGTVRYAQARWLNAYAGLTLVLPEPGRGDDRQLRSIRKRQREVKCPTW